MSSINAHTLQDPVIRHMRRDFPRLWAHQTVGEALDWLREHPPAGQIIYFYVVDSNNVPHGVVSARNLLLEPYDKRLADILIRPILTVSSKASVLDASELFLKHKLMALPVVDENGQMLGVMDTEVYTGALSQLNDPKTQDDLFQLIGVHVSNARPVSSVSAFRLRFPWLGCNLAAGILAAFLSGVFQSELSRAVALAFFIPVVLNLAESVSSQSVSLALELLHGEVPTWSSMTKKLRREGLTGLLLGLGSGAIVGLVALVWLGQTRVALCLLGGIAGGVTGAALLGLTMPYLLRLLRLEPQVAAGPIALAGSDVITLLIYLNLARWLLQ